MDEAAARRSAVRQALRLGTWDDSLADNVAMRAFESQPDPEKGEADDASVVDGPASDVRVELVPLMAHLGDQVVALELDDPVVRLGPLARRRHKLGHDLRIDLSNLRPHERRAGKRTASRSPCSFLAVFLSCCSSFSPSLTLVNSHSQLEDPPSCRCRQLLHGSGRDSTDLFDEVLLRDVLDQVLGVLLSVSHVLISIAK